MDNCWSLGSPADDIRVRPAEHQDVEDEIRQGCQRGNLSSIQRRGCTLVPLRNSPQGHHPHKRKRRIFEHIARGPWAVFVLPAPLKIGR